jgi:Flp pilus assembly protein TadG
MIRKNNARKGVTALEFAVVVPVAVFMILALIVGAMGIHRYQEVSHLAREGSRYASTHGGQYTLDGQPAKTGVPAVASNSDMTTYLLTKVALLDPNNMTVAISWSAPATLNPINMPYYVDTNPNLVPPGQITLQNYVTVTVSYQWMPELYLVGPITLTSTSTVAMQY